MATILNFKPRQASERRVRPSGAQGELILFPGVRYERQVPVKASAERGGGKGVLDRAKPQF